MPAHGSRRSSRRLAFTAILAVLFILNLAPQTWAWGPLGHRVVGQFAERHLTAKTREAVKILLEPGETLADCSNWADEHVRDIKGSGCWHYVDVPLSEPRYDSRFSAPVPEKGCIVDKIAEFRAILKDQSKTIQERRLALRFVVHLVEDLHMPLHVGDNHDRGGNDIQVRWLESGSNLHRVWDSQMIEQTGNTEEFWLANLHELDTESNRDKWMSGSVEDWATESLLLARVAHQIPGTGAPIMSGQELGDPYHRANLPAVRQRLAQAGVRLAWVLNEAFPEN
jgi:nuclease S1